MKEPYNPGRDVAKYSRIPKDIRHNQLLRKIFFMAIALLLKKKKCHLITDNYYKSYFCILFVSRSPKDMSILRYEIICFNGQLSFYSLFFIF